METSRDIQLVIAALRDLAPGVRPSTDRAWVRDPALRVIDCVLSLNRNYDRFVVPRLDSFERNFPSVRTVRELRQAIAEYPSPNEFVVQTLRYNHSARASTLWNVTTWLSDIGGSGKPTDQLRNIELWAKTASYNDYERNKILGFGLAGFQYMRMLFGANTTKPDIKICRWISGIVGHEISAATALSLLEHASVIARVRLLDLDTTIWEMSTRRANADQFAKKSGLRIHIEDPATGRREGNRRKRRFSC